jgi:methanogenic corrinoid protein MtbC1
MSCRENIINGMRVLDEDKVLANAEQAIRDDIDRLLIIDWLNLGMKEVGKLYESQEYYIVELIMSEIIFNNVLALEGFKNWTNTNASKSEGLVLLGTVNGDNHDIGKNIFKSMTEAVDIKVVDLGVDVPVETFVAAIREYHPDILALSGILTTSIKELNLIVRRLEAEALRDQLKILIGSPVLSEQTAREIGADAYTSDTAEGMEVCRKWIAEKEKR